MKSTKKLVSDMIKKDRRSKNALTFSKPSMPSSPSEGFKNVASVFKDLAKPSPIVSASRGAAIGGISGIGKAMTTTPKFSSTPSPRITIPVQPRPIQPRIPSPLPKSGKQYWLPRTTKNKTNNYCPYRKVSTTNIS